VDDGGDEWWKDGLLLIAHSLCAVLAGITAYYHNDSHDSSMALIGHYAYITIPHGTPLASSLYSYAPGAGC